MWYGIGIVALLVLVFAPTLLERMRPAIGAKQRAGADGGFAELSMGVTHYRWLGPVRGPVAVLVHGLASPLIAIEDFAEGLGQMGYRVLMYDLYGRGLSDAPPMRQNRSFFLRQLTELLEHQGIREELTIVGYSMGGSIATAYAAENTHRISRVVLLAPTGVIAKESTFSGFCRTAPFIGDWVHGMFARSRIMRAIPVDSSSPQVARVLTAQRAELKRRGYLPAILSSRRGFLADSMKEDHRKLRREDVPVFAIWAEDDLVIPISALGILAQWNRAARQEVVSNADHALPYTHCDELLGALRKAMRD